MFKALRVKNYGCHKDTLLNFHPGFNAIIGTTDSGKSSLYRAMRWVRFNKASQPISFWNTNKSGQPKEETSATVETTGEVEHCVSRVRRPGLNGYVLDTNAPLEAAGRGEPPPSVIDCLRVSDINFFSQHDKPFLLDESPGEVAARLNALIHLEDIDTVLSSLAKKKSDNKKIVDSSSAALEEARTKLLALDWTDEAKKALDIASQVQIDMEQVDKDAQALSSLLAAHESACVSFERAQGIVFKATPIIEELTRLSEEIDDAMKKYTELSGIIDSIDTIRKSLVRLERTDATKELAACDAISKELEEVASDLESISEYVEKYQHRLDLVASMQVELSLVEAEIAKVELCPECGRPLEECDDSM